MNIRSLFDRMVIGVIRLDEGLNRLDHDADQVRRRTEDRIRNYKEHGFGARSRSEPAQEASHVNDPRVG